MKIKKWACFLCAILITANCCTAIGHAEYTAGEMIAPAAVDAVLGTNQFELDIPARTIVQSDSSFLLAIGEEVTINAAYWPNTASVDFGLIAPDGLFYPVNAANGSINKTIIVNQRGYYTLAIRNNANYEITVTGFVSY